MRIFSVVFTLSRQINKSMRKQLISFAQVTTFLQNNKLKAGCNPKPLAYAPAMVWIGTWKKRARVFALLVSRWCLGLEVDFLPR